MTKHKTRLAPTAKAIFGFVNVIASLCVGMAVYAVCFVAVVIAVLFVGNRLQVERIAASSVSAFVMDFKPFRNGSNEEPVGGSVGFAILAVETKPSIAVAGYASKVVPTACFKVKLDSAGETINEWNFIVHIRKEITPILKVKPADESRNQNEGYKVSVSSFLSGRFKAV